MDGSENYSQLVLPTVGDYCTLLEYMCESLEWREMWQSDIGEYLESLNGKRYLAPRYELRVPASTNSFIERDISYFRWFGWNI